MTMFLFLFRENQSKVERERKRETKNKLDRSFDEILAPGAHAYFLSLSLSLAPSQIEPNQLNSKIAKNY